MMQEIFKSSTFSIYASIVIIFTAWTIFFRLPFITLFHFILFVWIFIRFLNNFSIKKLIVPFLYSIVFFRYFLIVDDFLDSATIIYNLIEFSVFSGLFLISTKDRFEIYNVLIELLSVIIGFGLIFHVLQLLGVDLLLSITNFSHPESGRKFAVYLTQSYEIILGSISKLRFSSIFDEPGYLGTFLAFILTIEKYNLTKRSNQIFFIAGVLTLSMSFYFLALIYYVISGLIVRYIGKSAILIMFSIVAFVFILNFIPDVNKYFFNRFYFIEGRGLSDSRANIDDIE
jgi:hypothetical protein